MKTLLLALALCLPAYTQTLETHAWVGSRTGHWEPWANRDNGGMFIAGLGVGLVTDAFLQAKGVKHRWVYVILSGLTLGALQEIVVHGNKGNAQWASVANAGLGAATAYGINFEIKVRF